VALKSTWKSLTICKTLLDERFVSGCVLIIDVFRSSNTIIELLNKGARAIIPVIETDTAFQLKEKNPDYLLFGERNGIMVEGFDGDNSPAQNIAKSVEGMIVVLTTSGGTRCINACNDSCDVIIASFANAYSVIKYLKDNNYDNITFWAVGQKGEIPSIEDNICAYYLQRLFLDKPVDFKSLKEEIQQSDGAKRLRELGQYDDLKYCLEENVKDIVPRCIKTSDGLKIIEA